jgi:outer membrane immunogenic protein
VLGVEADIQAADIRANSSAPFMPFPGVGGFLPYNSSTNTGHFVDWWGTARGRLGLTLPSWPNLMFYGTGGFAYGGVNSVFNYSALVAGVGGFSSHVYDNTRLGWAAGGGFEYSPMAFPTWSLKLEYLYTDLGSYTQTSFGVGSPPTFTVSGTQSVPNSWHTVRAGVNWHFNPFYSAPILAKY